MEVVEIMFEDPFSLFTLTILALGLVLVFSAVCQVRQTEEWTVERFGRYIRTLRPGLHLILPIVDRIGNRMLMTEQVLNVPTQEIITRDNAQVTVDGVLFYQVVDAPRAAYEVHNLDFAMTNLTMTNLRTVLGSMELDEVLSQRDTINAKLMDVIDNATQPWGIKVTRVEIKDMAPQADLVDAMAKQMKAEREKRAAILEAEGWRQAQIQRAEGEKRAAILEAEAIREAEIQKAEGQKQAAILKAEGQREAAFRVAEGRERELLAEAVGSARISKALAEGDLQAINYMVAQRYTDALGRIASAPNQKVVMMPLEAGNLMGSIAGITEIAKTVLDRNAADDGALPKG